MSNPDSDLLALREGQAAQHVVEITERQLSELEASVERRIYNVFQRGEALDPNIAVQAWIEKHSYRRLRQKLHQQVKVGQRAAERLGESFEMEDDK